MDERSDVAAAITAAARTINQKRSLDETLQTIVEVARDTLPGFDQVGISTVDRSGKVSTRAVTGDLVYKLDKVQHDLGEGPCIEALGGASVVLAPNIAHDQRWPRYVPLAVEVGLRSHLAVKLYVDDDRTVGVITGYSTTSDDIDPDAAAIAELFAAHAALAVGHAQERHELSEAMHTRAVIGQAVGIIMERLDLDEDAAFAFLVRASSTSNIKLRDIAQELVWKRKTI